MAWDGSGRAASTPDGMSREMRGRVTMISTRNQWCCEGCPMTPNIKYSTAPSKGSKALGVSTAGPLSPGSGVISTKLAQILGSFPPAHEWSVRTRSGPQRPRAFFILRAVRSGLLFFVARSTLSPPTSKFFALSPGFPDPFPHFSQPCLTPPPPRTLHS